jgi:predicted MFS family arabinose efflux permease
MGLNQTHNTSANIAAPPLSGALIDHGLYATWAFTMAAIAACGAITALRILASPQTKTEALDKPHAYPEPIRRHPS